MRGWHTKGYKQLRESLNSLEDHRKAKQAIDEIGDDFDLGRDDTAFTDEGAVICREVEILPLGTIEPEHRTSYKR